MSNNFWNISKVRKYQSRLLWNLPCLKVCKNILGKHLSETKQFNLLLKSRMGQPSCQGVFFLLWDLHNDSLTRNSFILACFF